MNAYNIDWWGNGYFSVNEKGHVTVNPTKSEQTSVKTSRAVLFPANSAKQTS